MLLVTVAASLVFLRRGHACSPDADQTRDTLSIHKGLDKVCVVISRLWEPAVGNSLVVVLNISRLNAWQRASLVLHTEN